MSSPRTELKAAIFDWAGTTVDYGSLAPTTVVVEIFRQRGIEITLAEARGPMGVAKRDHIAALLALPRVADQWRERFSRAPSDDDIQSIYDAFLPRQKEILAAHGSRVLPGIPEAITKLRSRGVKIGSTTGYTRELMDIVVPIAARDGYAPDALVCSDDVRAGRPAPWMNFRAAELLGVFPLSSVVIVDDTPVGIAAGRNAGALTVAISQTGNALGLSQSEVAALPPTELHSRLAQIEREFLASGAHLVLPSVADLPNHWDHLSSIPTDS